MNNLFSTILNSQNPMQIVNNIIRQNPQAQNVLNAYNQMVQGKSQEEIKEIVRNLCNERHMDFNEIEKMVNNRK